MSDDINVTDGIILEALNTKIDLDGSNYKGSELETYIHEHCGADKAAEKLVETLTECIAVVETYQNGTSWYRVYSDGWCEQGGAVDSISASPSITFLKPFKYDDFSILISQAGNAQPALGFSNPTRTGFLWTTNSGERAAVWQAKGYIS